MSNNISYEYDIFLSFASEDKDKVDKLYSKLIKNKFRVFYSNVNLKEKVGYQFSCEIFYALKNSRHFLLFCTDKSIEKKFVTLEYEAFMNEYYDRYKRRFILYHDREFNRSKLPCLLTVFQDAYSTKEIIYHMCKERSEENAIKNNGNNFDANWKKQPIVCAVKNGRKFDNIAITNLSLFVKSFKYKVYRLRCKLFRFPEETLDDKDKTSEDKVSNKGVDMSRRLPIYIAIDTSGSMYGEAIQSVNVGLQAMLTALRQDPHALDSVHLSVITFDIEVKELFPLTPLSQVQIGEIICPRSGPTYTGEALALIVERTKRDIISSTSERKGDWRPMLFLMTDGSPSDVARYDEILPQIKNCHFGRIIACAAGPKAKIDQLRKLTDTIVSLDTTDSTAFSSFFKWVSASVEMRSSSIGAGSADVLPPPPAEIQIVI